MQPLYEERLYSVLHLPCTPTAFLMQCQNSSVRQRHSYLKSRCQTHLIYIEINIAFKPDLNIYIRHFSQRIKTFRFLVNPPAQVRSGTSGSYFFKIRFFSSSFMIFVFRHKMSLNSPRIFLRCDTYYIRRKIHLRLHLNNRFSYALRFLCTQWQTRSPTRLKRLFHIVHHIRDNSEIFLRVIRHRRFFLPKISAVCFARPDSSKRSSSYPHESVVSTSDIAKT